MSLFTTTLNYALDDPIQVRVTAYNLKGSSDSPSEISDLAAIAKLIPQQMSAALITYGPETSEYQIQVQWGYLTTNEEIGGSPIVSYNLQMLDTTWVDLVGEASDYILNSFTLTDGVVPGLEI